ncbi:MAG: hypothetical protein K5896_00600 [Prevotella sp.]|nr:hypothetical protein [Prevotella sp.]
MTLHVFNPDHDLALASGLENFTAPHAGRQLRHDLGWLPAMWADENDCVLVDDVPTALKSIRHRRVSCRQFVSYQQIASLPITHIEPWGWNAALCAQLRRFGVDSGRWNVESGKRHDWLDTIRELSHRRTAAQLLPQLQTDGTVGEATECTTMDEVQALVSKYGKAVLKAPWSSSGRGVRFLSSPNGQSSAWPKDVCNQHDARMIHDQSLDGWLRNTLQRQGSVMVEPFYTKMRDFGMEFYSDGKGSVTYLGLSLFHTSNGAYTGNIIATEQAKREMLSRYLPTLLLDQTQERICQIMGNVFNNKYQGPFGIDMMVVSPPSCLPQLGEVDYVLKALHPCVEINLRRTMGHVALSLDSVYNPTADDEVRHVMRINYFNNNYKLQIRRQ